MSSPSDTLSDSELQHSLAALVREYASRADENRALSPFPSEHGVTATDAMVTISAILAATNLQLFELGMWQSWSGRH